MDRREIFKPKPNKKPKRKDRKEAGTKVMVGTMLTGIHGRRVFE